MLRGGLLLTILVVIICSQHVTSDLHKRSQIHRADLIHEIMGAIAKPNFNHYLKSIIQIIDVHNTTLVNARLDIESRLTTLQPESPSCVHKLNESFNRLCDDRSFFALAFGVRVSLNEDEGEIFSAIENDDGELRIYCQLDKGSESISYDINQLASFDRMEELLGRIVRIDWDRALRESLLVQANTAAFNYNRTTWQSIGRFEQELRSSFDACVLNEQSVESVSEEEDYNDVASDNDDEVSYLNKTIENCRDHIAVFASLSKRAVSESRIDLAFDRVQQTIRDMSLTFHSFASFKELRKALKMTRLLGRGYDTCHREPTRRFSEHLSSINERAKKTCALDAAALSVTFAHQMDHFAHDFYQHKDDYLEEIVVCVNTEQATRNRCYEDLYTRRNLKFEKLRCAFQTTVTALESRVQVVADEVGECVRATRGEDVEALPRELLTRVKECVSGEMQRTLLERDAAAVE